MEKKFTVTVLQPGDPAYERYVQRIKEDLGLDEEAAEIIMNLRNQVTTLQTRLHTLEADIEIYRSSRVSRLTHYREIFYEAEWEETDE